MGSILRKIKVQEKQYSFKEFSSEFRSLIKDLDDIELKEILRNTQFKKNKKSKGN